VSSSHSSGVWVPRITTKSRLSLEATNPGERGPLNSPDFRVKSLWTAAWRCSIGRYERIAQGFVLSARKHLSRQTRGGNRVSRKGRGDGKIVRLLGRWFGAQVLQQKGFSCLRRQPFSEIFTPNRNCRHYHNLLQFGPKRDGTSPPPVGGRTQTLRAEWRYGTYRDQI
jgi:hypothetical protein